MAKLRERHLMTLRAAERGDVYLASDWEYRRRDAAPARHVSEAVYVLEESKMLRLDKAGVSVTLRGLAWLRKRCQDFGVTPEGTE